MASKTVVDAVLARLADQWTTCPVRVGAIQTQTPGDGSAFLVVQFPVADVERVAVNQRTYRETGGIRLLILTDRNDGADKPLAWAAQLATIFRDREFGGIRTEVPGSIALTDDIDDGLYLRTSFAVPFYRYFHDEE